MDTASLIKKNVATYSYMKHNGIPTIPTMRQIGPSSIFMTDLTEWWKYRIDGFTKWDAFWGNRVKIFWSGIINRLREAGSKSELKSILIEKFEEIRKICIAKWVEVKMVDWFFIKIRNGKTTITKDDVDIIIGDLDNVSIVGLWKWWIPYDSQYLADIFIKQLTN
jgi:hypothetical protein